MAERILVINPNSTASVTAAIADAVRPLGIPGGPVIDCVTLAEGPPGIETDRHAAEVVAPMLRLIEREPARAYVVACYSDPGLAAARELANAVPVFGISESSVARALTRGERFGIIAILPASVRRQQRMVRAMALEGRYAGSRSIGVGVVETAAGGHALGRMVATGRALCEQDGADVIIMGCAGMAAMRGDLEAALGVPVIEPCQAAVGDALGAVLLACAESGRLPETRLA